MSQRDMLGSEHAETLMSQAQLGAALRLAGELDESRDHLSYVVAVRTRTFGDDHLETLMARAQLADTLRHLGQLKEARGQLEAVIHGRTQQLGSHHPETKRAVKTLSKIASTIARRRAEAEAAFVKRRNAARAQLLRGRIDDARRQLEALLADQVATQGPDSPGVRATKAELDRITPQGGDVSGH